MRLPYGFRLCCAPFKMTAGIFAERKPALVILSEGKAAKARSGILSGEQSVQKLFQKFLKGAGKLFIKSFPAFPLMKIGFVSLGCPKNLVDTEVMLKILADAGYEITPDETVADIIIVNTCGFIQSAKEEAIENILDVFVISVIEI